MRRSDNTIFLIDYKNSVLRIHPTAHPTYKIDIRDGHLADQLRILSTNPCIISSNGELAGNLIDVMILMCKSRFGEQLISEQLNPCKNGRERLQKLHRLGYDLKMLAEDLKTLNGRGFKVLDMEIGSGALLDTTAFSDQLSAYLKNETMSMFAQGAERNDGYEPTLLFNFYSGVNISRPSATRQSAASSSPDSSTVHPNLLKPIHR